MENLEGITLNNRYYLRRFLGRGASSDVYEAWDQHRKANVAIKALKITNKGDHWRRELFKKEVKLLQELKHPYIIPLYEEVVEDDLMYLVMPWINGVDLGQKIRTHEGPFSTGEVLSILQPVCSALYFAHSKKIYHCDVKPANILLEVTGNIYLFDFGVAKTNFDNQAGGTPAYMSPEYICQQPINHQTDIYSLGISIYQMLSGGILPFRGESRSSIKTKRKRDIVEWEHVNMPPPDLRKYNPKLHPAIIAVVDKAIQKKLEQRYQSVLDLLKEFQNAHEIHVRVSTDENRLDETIVTTSEPNSYMKPTIQPDAQKPPNQSVQHGPYLIGSSGEWKGKIIPIYKHEFSIGRDGVSHLQLREKSVSRSHATIILSKTGAVIKDNHSKYGTYINGAQVINPTSLRDGDQIQISFTYIFEFHK
jgi:serine/threonine protein kinase